MNSMVYIAQTVDAQGIKLHFPYMKCSREDPGQWWIHSFWGPQGSNWWQSIRGRDFFCQWIAQLPYFLKEFLRELTFFWVISETHRIRMLMVYILNKLGYIDGKCGSIYGIHTDPSWEINQGSFLSYDKPMGQPAGSLCWSPALCFWFCRRHWRCWWVPWQYGGRSPGGKRWENIADPSSYLGPQVQMMILIWVEHSSTTHIGFSVELCLL